MPNPVVHFEITGADGPALQSFYRDLFDWKIDANNEWQYGTVEAGGEGGINGGIAGDPDGSARVSVYAAVDDLQSYLDKAERLGATVVMPVTELSKRGSFAELTLTHSTMAPQASGKTRESKDPLCPGSPIIWRPGPSGALVHQVATTTSVVSALHDSCAWVGGPHQPTG